jgi:hypothetical protein
MGAVKITGNLAEIEGRSEIEQTPTVDLLVWAFILL